MNTTSTTLTVTIANAKLRLTSSHRTTDPRAALERAVAKNFGSGAKFIENRELSRDGLVYGQVGSPRGNGYNLLTGTVRVTIE